MCRFLAVLLIMCAVPAMASPGVVDVPAVAAERVAELPQDAGLPYLTVYGSPNDPAFRRVCQWFQTHAGLTAFKVRTRFNEVRTRCRNACTTRVRLQGADGIVWLEMSGHEVPDTADGLLAQLNAYTCNAEAKRFCPNERCIRPLQRQQPEQEQAEPKRDPEPQRLAPVIRREAPARRRPPFPTLALLGVCVAGGAAGVAIGWQQTHKVA